VEDDKLRAFQKKLVATDQGRCATFSTMETCEAAGCSYHANAKAKIVKCVTQENHFYIAAINEQRKQLRIDAGAFADPDLTCAGPCPTCNPNPCAEPCDCATGPIRCFLPHLL